MSALRLCVLAVAVATLAAAHSHMMYSGNAGACGTAPSAAPLFGNSSVQCTKAATCQATYCTCIGAAAPTNFVCGAMTTAPNCTVAAMCVAAKMACINMAADDVSAGCAALKDLKMSNLAVAGGQLYNQSAAYMACKHEACVALNSTAGNCTLDFTKLCKSPVRFVGSMLLKGNWAAFLNDATKKATLQAALEKDLTKALRFLVKILKMFIKVNRRRQGESSLVVEFEASGVSGNNAALQASLAAVKAAGGSFLTETLAAYKAENGANASFTFQGVSAGSSSSAVFSNPGSAASTTSGTTGATTGTTTGTTGSATTGTTGTTTGSATTGSNSSGAATQSLMAAVVVAVIGAMLF